MTSLIKPRIAIPIPTSTDPEYNRQCWPEYAEAIRTAGGDPVEIALNVTQANHAQLMQSCDAVLLPGSPADVDPRRYGHDTLPACAPADLAREQVDLLLLEHAEANRKPILGICFGAQILNVWRGGTLVQDLTVLPVNHAAGRGVAVAHAAAVPLNSTLASVLHEASELADPTDPAFLRLPINSSHHQAICIPGQGLRISARCPQDAVIEAVESYTSGPFLVGVQWHPERGAAVSEASGLLFQRFVAEAAASR